MPDIFSEYEKKLLRKILASHKRIKGVYHDAINEVSLTASKIKYQDVVFDLNKHPALKRKVERLLEKMHTSIFSVISNSVLDSWDLANEKNNILVDRKLKGRDLPAKVNQILYDSNKPAQNAFLKRVENGMNLSDRVWRTLDPFKVELEQGLSKGIREGQPARQMATEIKKNLLHPDKVFRRVRDENGKLQLSKSARNFHPGKGVYRSSFKNALRLTATETNMSYRTADHERWKTSPLVKAIEVRLSTSHPKFDICDHLVGIYPKDFHFRGWHPFCLCYATSVLTSDAEFDKQLDAILGLGEEPEIKNVTEIPAKAKKYFQKNAKRINGWKNKPYWLEDNPQYLNNFFK